MTSDSWFMLFPIAFHALLFHVMPRLSRPDILFAVTVPEAFASGDGRTIVSRYRAIVWTGALVAGALVLLLTSHEFLRVAAVAGNLIVGLSAWLWANRKARAHAIVPSDVRVASLVPRDTSLPGGALFAGGPFAILLASAALVLTHWNELPEAARTIKTFGPLAMGAVQVALMLTMAVSLSRRTRQVSVEGMAAAAEQRFRRVNVFVIVLVGYGMAIMLSAVTLSRVPSFGEALNERVGFLLLPLMLFNFAVGFWMFRVGQGGQRALPASERQDTRGDATPDHAWKIGGMFYFNPKDPAIWVEQRVGIGYTLNMGNRSAWLLIGIMFVPMIAAQFFLF